MMPSKTSFAELYEETKNKMGFNGCHGFDHVERVMKMCRYIGKREKADLEVLKFAALLHDIDRRKEDEGLIECHAEGSAETAKDMLSFQGLSIEFTDKVSSCIRTHRYRKGETPVSVEAKILADADRLDAMGAVGIGRAFLFGGEHGQRLWVDRIASKKERFFPGMDASEYSPVIEYRLKLSKLKEGMLTRTGKKEAEERHRFMEAFFKELEDELSGKR
ncbi:MAG: HD domain-containing protein [Candidatus Hydrothermarchaeales archaeon]